MSKDNEDAANKAAPSAINVWESLKAMGFSPEYVDSTRVNAPGRLNDEKWGNYVNSALSRIPSYVLSGNDTRLKEYFLHKELFPGNTSPEGMRGYGIAPNLNTTDVKNAITSSLPPLFDAAVAQPTGAAMDKYAKTGIMNRAPFIHTGDTAPPSVANDRYVSTNPQSGVGILDRLAAGYKAPDENLNAWDYKLFRNLGGVNPLALSDVRGRFRSMVRGEGWRAGSQGYFEPRLNALSETRPHNFGEFRDMAGDIVKASAYRFANVASIGSLSTFKGLYMSYGGNPFWLEQGKFGNYDSTNPWVQLGGMAGETAGFFVPWSKPIEGASKVLGAGERVLARGEAKLAAAGYENAAARGAQTAMGIGSKGLGKAASSTNKAYQAVKPLAEFNPIKIMHAPTDLAAKGPVGRVVAAAEAHLGSATADAVQPLATDGVVVLARDAGRRSPIRVIFEDVMGRVKGTGLAAGESTLSAEAEAKLNEVYIKAVKKAARAGWDVARNGGFGKDAIRAIGNSATNVSTGTFLITARDELKRVLGNTVDDVVIAELASKMTDDFAVNIAKHGDDAISLFNPRYAFSATGKTNDLYRVATNAALEGSGFGFHHLVSTIGPYWEQAAIQRYYSGEDDMWGSAGDASKEWARQFDPRSASSVWNTFGVGVAFNTKGGLGLLPAFRNRPVGSMAKAFDNAFGKQGMTTSEAASQFFHQASLDQLVRAAELLGVDVAEAKRILADNPSSKNVPLSQQFKVFLADAVKSSANAADANGKGRLPITAKGWRKFSERLRGNYANMPHQQVATLAAISKAYAEKHPHVTEGGLLSTGRWGGDTASLIRDLADINTPHSIKMAARQALEEKLRLEAEENAQRFAKMSRQQFRTEFFKAAATSGAIFATTGGPAMVINGMQEGLSGEEMGSIFTHVVFSVMSGMNSPYMRELPDRLAREGGIDRMTMGRKDWNRDFIARANLSDLRARAFYSGGVSNRFITSYKPIPEHVIRNTSKWADEDYARMSSSVAEYVDRDVKSTNNADSEYHPATYVVVENDVERQVAINNGLTPTTNDELRVGYDWLNAELHAGGRVDTRFSFGQELNVENPKQLLAAVDASDNRSQYLGSVVAGLKRYGQELGVIKPGEDLRPEHLLRMQITGTQIATETVAGALDKILGYIVSKQKNITGHDGRNIARFSVEDDPEMNKALEDLFFLANQYRSPHRPFDAETSGIKKYVKTTNSPQQILRLMENDDPNFRAHLKELVDQFNDTLHKAGFHPNLRLGDANRNLVEVITGAVEWAARNRPFGLLMGNNIPMNGVDTHTLHKDGILEAGMASGMIIDYRSPQLGNRKLLRPMTSEWLATLSPLEAARARTAHALMEADPRVFALSEEAAQSDEFLGLAIGSTKGEFRGNQHDMRKILDVHESTDGGGNVIGHTYNPIFHEGGFFGALDAAGIDVSSTSAARRVISSIARMRRAGITESTAAAFAAAKQLGMIRTNSKGSWLMAPMGFANVSVNMNELGHIPAGTAVSMIGSALNDRRIPNNTSEPVPMATGSLRDGNFRDILSAMLSRPESADLPFRDVVDLAYEEAYGIKFTELMRRLQPTIDSGLVQGWDTSDGTIGGTPLFMRTAQIDENLSGIWREMLDPLIGVPDSRRTEELNRIIGKVGKSDPKGTRTVKLNLIKKLLASMTKLDDATSLSQLRFLLSNIGHVKVVDGYFTITDIDPNSATYSDYQIRKMIDRYDFLISRHGSIADYDSEFRALFDTAIHDMNETTFGRHPHTRIISMSKVLSRIGVSKVFMPEYMLRFGGVADRLADAPASPNDPGNIEASCREFKALMREAATVSGTIGDPRVTEYINGLTDTDIIAARESVRNLRPYMMLTFDNRAANVIMGDVEIPAGAAERDINGDLPNEGVSNTAIVSAPVGLESGQYRYTIEMRRHGILDDIHENVGSRKPAQFSYMNGVTNLDMIHSPEQLIPHADRAYRYGQSTAGGDNNVIFESPIGTDKASARALFNSGSINYGPKGDPNPQIFVPFETSVEVFDAPRTPEDLKKLVDQGDQLVAALGEETPEGRTIGEVWKRVRSAIVDPADGELRGSSFREVAFPGSLSISDNGVVLIRNVSRSNIDRNDISLIYAGIARMRVFGHGTHVRPDGTYVRAMDSARGPKAAKRLKQNVADLDRVTNDGLASAIEITRRRTGRSIPGQSVVNGQISWRVLILAERPDQKMGAVTAGDGHGFLTRGAIEALTTLGGLDGGRLQDDHSLLPEIAGGAVKGFVQGDVGGGFMIGTKMQWAVADNVQEAALRAMDITGAIYRKSVTIGNFTGQMINVGGRPYYFDEAAAHAYDAEFNEVDIEITPSGPVITITPDMMYIQSIPDPVKMGDEAHTLQLVNGHEDGSAIASYLNDQDIFAIKAMKQDVARLGEPGIQSQALDTAVYISGKEDGIVVVSPVDIASNGVSIVDLIYQAGLTYGEVVAPGVLFPNDTRKRVIAAIKDRAMKGRSRRSTTSWIKPDKSGALPAGTGVADPISEKVPFLMKGSSSGRLGIWRNRNADGSTYEFEDAEEDMYLRDNKGQPREEFHYNSTPGGPDNANLELRTKVVTMRADEPYSNKNGRVTGFLGNAVHELRGGGAWRHGNVEDSTPNPDQGQGTPLFRIFSPDSPHLSSENFEPMAKAVSDAFANGISAPDRSTGLTAINEALSGIDEYIGPDMANELRRQFNIVFEAAFARSESTPGIRHGEMSTGAVRDAINGMLGWSSDSQLDGTYGQPMNFEQRIIDKDGRDVMGGRGKTPLLAGTVNNAQRTPSVKTNDTITTIDVAVHPNYMGGIRTENRPDAVYRGEKDYDGDKQVNMYSLPNGIIQSISSTRNVLGEIRPYEQEAHGGFTWAHPGEQFSINNPVVQYIRGRHISQPLVGSLVNSIQATNKMVAEHYTITISTPNANYKLSPRMSRQQMMRLGLGNSVDVVRALQTVLDQAGKVLPDEIERLDINKLTFGKLFKRTLLDRNGRPIEDADTNPLYTADRELDAFDYSILGNIMQALVRGMSVANDTYTGNEKSQKGFIDISLDAADHVAMFGDRIINPNSGETNVEQNLIRYLMDDYNGHRYSEAEKAIIQKMKISLNPQVSASDAVATWVSHLTDAYNGALSAPTKMDPVGSLAIGALDRSTEQYAMFDGIMQLMNSREIATAVSQARSEIAMAGSLGSKLRGPLAGFEGRAQKAIDMRRTIQTGLVVPNLRTREGLMLRRLADNLSIVGRAWWNLGLTIEDTMGPLSNSAAIEMGSVAQTNSQLWARALSQSVPDAISNVRPHMIQQILEARLRASLVNLQREAGGEINDSFEQLLHIAIKPRELFVYQGDRERNIAFEPPSTNIIAAFMAINPGVTEQYLLKLNRMAMVIQDQMSGMPIINGLELLRNNEIFMGAEKIKTSRKTMARQFFRYAGTEHIQELMNENLIAVGRTPGHMDPFINGVVPLGQRGENVSEITKEGIQILKSITDDPTNSILYRASTGRARVLNIPGANVFGMDLDNVTVSAQMQAGGVARNKAYQDILQNDVAPEIAKKLGKSVDQLSNDEWLEVAGEAERRFNNINRATFNAIMDNSSSANRKSILSSASFLIDARNALVEKEAREQFRDRGENENGEC